ncbi:MAG TPA: efflux RND transporter periplasmic adaptor subunit [Vicinamibacterales bacterium]|nr:efflux RND transporter periplasmic adaptor subunit [Vicinamibacterales bacterium]
MNKLIIILIVVAAIGGGVAAYYMRKSTPEPTVTTLQLTRGDVVDSVGATGTLGAVETVDVGTQVSGTVQELYADFNSIVRKGQVIARLDPSLLQTNIEQQRANVTRSQADLERLRVNLADARRKRDQASQLWDKQLIPRDQFETAELNVKTQEAQLRSGEAGLVQSRSLLNTAQVNLGHTVIRAPIDGIVISRNVDQGQTVAASMNAPTLFVLAADLTKMQVLANIDEADVGRIRPGQPVSFRVDAYPTDSFTGTVSQVRLQPTTVQNVVTYSTVISVPNPDLRLKPGMTASPLTIEIMRKNNVLRAPNAALRFRPSNDLFAALKQEVPPEMQRGGRGGPGASPARGQAGPGAGPQQAAATSPGDRPAAPPAAAATAPRPRERRDRPAQAASDGPGARAQGGGGSTGPPREDRAAGGGEGRRGGGFANMTPEEREARRKQFEERMKNMSPEDRERMQARMREGGGRGGGRGGGPGIRPGGDRAAVAPQGNARPERRPAAAAPTTGIASTGATTIDALFAPLPVVEGRGRVWLFLAKQLKPVAVRTGISDGTWTEIIESAENAPLKEGTDVVTNATTGLEQQSRPGQQGAGSNPLMGGQRGNQPRGGTPGGVGGRGR